MSFRRLISDVSLYEPRILALDTLASAAVLIAVTEGADPHVILTQRSTDMPTHKGEVAFPGGKTEPQDADAVATALREAFEEVGLNPADVQVVGQLDQVVSRFGFLVTPILGIVPADVHLNDESQEIDSVFKVPLSFFLQGQPDQIDQFGSFRGPRWIYQGYTIWGLTAIMLAEFFNEFYGTQFELALGNLLEVVQESHKHSNR